MHFAQQEHDLAAVRAALAGIGFTGGQSIAVEFLPDPDFARQLLPPGLEPAEQPLMRCGVSHFTGGTCGPFRGASLSLRARCGGLEGGYVVAMYVDSDDALLFGRELFAEPKKMADLTISRTGSTWHASVERKGARLIDIAFTPGETIAVEIERSDCNFNLAARFTPDGQALAADAQLVAVDVRSTLRSVTTGTATLKLGNGDDDPLGAIPIVEVLSAASAEMDSYAAARIVAEVPAALAYSHAMRRLPDWVRHARSGVTPA